MILQASSVKNSSIKKDVVFVQKSDAESQAVSLKKRSWVPKVCVCVSNRNLLPLESWPLKVATLRSIIITY